MTAGIAAQHIPPGLEARAAKWRDHAAGKKVLLLLDDVAGHEQVRPLLPGSADSLVLVTSRRRLTALEDAIVISIDTLSPDEAWALLTRLAGRADLELDEAPAGRSPGYADTCRWRSECWPGGSGITRPGPLPSSRPSWPRHATGWR